jgi:hypothetical protein
MLAGKGTDGKVLIADIDRAWLEQSHDRETYRLLKEAETGMEKVSQHSAVSERLGSMYDYKMAGRLYAFWFVMSADTEEVAKKHYPKATFHKYRGLLIDAGVSWLGTNVHLADHSLIPTGFSPTRNSPFRMTVQHPGVTAALVPFLRAA